MDYVKTHKDLVVWKEAIILAKEIYSLTAKFPKEEVYGLTSQMRRASVSIPSNIAEGAARNSSKEFVRFLYISLGSLAELETQLLISKELELIKDRHDRIDECLDGVRKMLVSLIKSLEKKQLSAKDV
jgi:four helix bundle protein